MLYIANTTKQHYHLHFRVPEHSRPIRVDIESGRQEEIGHGWNPSQVESVIQQLENYGARKANAVNGKLEGFPGILYSTSKAVTESQIKSGHESVVESQERRSAEEAKKAAVAFDVVNREGGKVKGKRKARVTEVEVKQDLPRGQKPSKDDINFKLSVQED